MTNTVFGMYSEVKPRVFLVKPHHTIDDEMLDRYLERRLVPAFDMFPEISLADADVEKLLMSKDVSDLPMDEFDAVEQALSVLSDIVGVDWIAIQRAGRKELYVAQVDCYEHIRYQAHLHVKHYIRIRNPFTIPYTDLDEALLRLIGTKSNLSELPAELYSLIQRKKPEEQPEDSPKTSIADADEEDLSFLDNDIEITNADPLNNQDAPVARPITDNQIVTAASLSSIQRKMDRVDSLKKLHSSIIEMQDYLRTNTTEISEYHSPDCDIAFKGIWQDGTSVHIFAFNLTDSRENSAWLIKIVEKD